MPRTVRSEIFRLIEAERDRQAAKYDQDHDRRHSRSGWIELLEVRLASADWSRLGTPQQAIQHYRCSLVQVAALVIAALECED